ncbi:MAG: hypothetical protein WAO00_14350 [Chthoniobacterales bacterium]
MNEGTEDHKESGTCFVIMPLTTPEHALATYHGDADHFRHIFDHLIVPAVERCGLSPIAPNAEGAELIHARIVEHLATATLVLCDMSALNPNVFFELGIRTALDKPVCLIKDDVTIKVPFDTTILNYHTYQAELKPWSLYTAVDALAKHIQQTIAQEPRNALWKYFAVAQHILPEPERDPRFAAEDAIEKAIRLGNGSLVRTARDGSLTVFWVDGLPRIDDETYKRIHAIADEYDMRIELRPSFLVDR